MVKIKIIMPRLKKEDNLEELANVPYTPTKPRTQNHKLKTMESIMKKSVPVVRRVKLSPEELREKTASIKYSRDYSFLFSDNEPVVRNYEAYKSFNQMPPKDRKPAPLKHSEEASKQKLQERRSSLKGFSDRRRVSYHHSKYSTEASKQRLQERIPQRRVSYHYSNYYSRETSRQNMKTSSQVGWREIGRNDVQQQDRVSGSRHERRRDREYYEGRHGTDQRRRKEW